MKVQLISPEALPPKRATNGASGFDCYAFVKGTISIYPGETKKVSLGFKMEVPDWSGAFLIPRSGLGCKGLILANTLGLVDIDYRGEVFAPLYNRSANVFNITNGDRICQMVITPVLLPEIEVVFELSETVRGEGGFGSTGVSQ